MIKLNSIGSFFFLGRCAGIYKVSDYVLSNVRIHVAGKMMTMTYIDIIWQVINEK